MFVPFVVVSLYSLVLIVAAVLAGRLVRLRHIPGYRALIVAMLAHCFLAITALMVCAATEFETKVLFSRLRYLGFSLFFPCILIFINSLYRHWRWLELKPVIVLIFFPAALAWVTTLWPPFWDLFVTDFEPINISGLSVLKFRNGPLFPLYIIPTYIGFTFTLFLALYVFLVAQGKQKMQVAVYGISFALVSLVDVYCIVFGSPWRWAMISGAAYVFADLAIIYAGLKHELFRIIPYATEKVFQTLPDPVLVVSKNNILEASNQAAHRAFGIDRYAYGKDLRKSLNVALTEKSEIHFKDRHFDVLREPIIGSGSIFYFREVTVRKENEDSLSASLDFKSRMLSLIAHDVVGNFEAQTSIMRRIQTDPDLDKDKAIKMVVDSHENLSDFLRNIINWEKTQIEGFAVVRSSFDARLFARGCIEPVGLLAEIRGIKIEPKFNFEAGAILHADSEVLSVIVRNLLANAIRVTGDGGLILLEITTENGKLTVDIVDQGPGVPAEKLSALKSDNYRPLFKIQPEGGGFGLGLYIVRKFIDLHDGDFRIESTEGLGARIGFSVVL